MSCLPIILVIDFIQIHLLQNDFDTDISLNRPVYLQ